MSMNSSAEPVPGAAAKRDIAEGKPASSVKVYTREGFNGEASLYSGANYHPEYLTAVGPHVPRRMILSEFAPSDETDDDAPPSLIANSRGGFRLRLSGRRGTGSYVIRNVEAEELHFIQDGEVRFETDVGSFTGVQGDFIYLPRSTAYRFYAVSGSMRSLIMESLSRYKFVTPYKVGMINFARDLVRPVVEPSARSCALPDGSTRMILRAWDGDDTVLTLPYDPLAVERHIGGESPAWKINIDKIQKLTSLPDGGPPYPFLATEDERTLLFNMGDRPTGNYRPPIHVNADFDEILHYVRGPAAWGGCDTPGTLTWIPKGIVHQGVAPSAPEPYVSWLLETKDTLRFTPEAVAASELMETATYGTHRT